MKRAAPAAILAARLAADLTQNEAARVVHRHLTDKRCDRWSEWETGKIVMPLCEWELFLLKAFATPAERRPYLNWK